MLRRFATVARGKQRPGWEWEPKVQCIATSSRVLVSFMVYGNPFSRPRLFASSTHPCGRRRPPWSKQSPRSPHLRSGMRRTDTATPPWWSAAAVVWPLVTFLTLILHGGTLYSETILEDPNVCVERGVCVYVLG